MSGNDFKYKLIMTSLRGVAALNLSILYGISDFLSFLTHRVLKYRVKVVRNNLKNSFPEKSDKDLKKIEKQFYHHLGDVIVETIKLLNISDKELKRRVKLQNTELVDSIVAEKKPIILFLGHYGNWEWVPVITKYYNNDLSMGTLYKPLHSHVMDRVMKAIRGTFNMELIESKTAYRFLLEKKRQEIPFMVGFIGDQRPLSANQKHHIEFLNQPTTVHIGGEIIGRKVGAKFLYLDVEMKKRGYYNLIFKEMNINENSPQDSPDNYPFTNLFFKNLEETIRRQPSLWLWSHNRWNMAL